MEILPLPMSLHFWMPVFPPFYSYPGSRDLPGQVLSVPWDLTICTNSLPGSKAPMSSRDFYANGTPILSKVRPKILLSHLHPKKQRLSRLNLRLMEQVPPRSKLLTLPAKMRLLKLKVWIFDQFYCNSWIGFNVHIASD